ncbi:hypothetical protein OROGR_032731 [Orobanche gracilis]
MGGSKVQFNKAHKTRFASKSSRNVHKVPSQDKHKVLKSDRSVCKGAKAARLQRNKMMREQKRAAILEEKRALSGPSSPPRVIVLFGLSAHVNLNSLEEDFMSLFSEEKNSPLLPAIASPTYKLRATVLKAPHGDFLTCMEMAKVADLLVFVASPNSLFEVDDTDSFIDSFGSQCLSVFRTIGLPSTVVLLRDLPNDLKSKNELKKMCSSMFASEFPEDCKFYPADEKDELHKFMWLLKEQRLTVPHWRNQRSYLMAQKVDVVAEPGTSYNSTLVLTGYLRSHGLSVNQLVHVSGAGDFQLSQIELLKDPCPLNLRKKVDSMDSKNDVQVVKCLFPDPLEHEPLVVENVPDLLAGEQTWPTEAEMAEADKNQKDKRMKKKRLPRGISEYQAAWIVDDSDVDYAGSDEGGDDDGMVLDDGENSFLEKKHDNGFEFDDDQASLNLRDSGDETETDSVMMEDVENLTKEQITDQIRKIKEAHAEDEEYPDEVDVPLDVTARKRFAKYRGVKSFRTSTWDPKESLPPEYAKIFAFDNFSRTQKHVLAKSLKMEKEVNSFIPAGSYVKLYIKNVPVDTASKLSMLAKKMPVIASGLLQHESKISVLHFSIRKHDTYDAPIKAKEELLFHVGFRQFVSRPKIILTGYPQRVSKLKATVRYMFHNPEDVRWFKPVDVWSKCGRRGRIKEPVGTHGAMKCIFNGVLQQHDTVCMSLFKRSYPKWPQRWFPLQSVS